MVPCITNLQIPQAELRDPLTVTWSMSLQVKATCSGCLVGSVLVFSTDSRVAIEIAVSLHADPAYVSACMYAGM